MNIKIVTDIYIGYRVYSWGWGVHGQLGHGDPEDQLTPKRIEALSDKQITSISGGYCHTLALSSQVSFINMYLISTSVIASNINLIQFRPPR